MTTETKETIPVWEERHIDEPLNRALETMEASGADDAATAHAAIFILQKNYFPHFPLALKTLRRIYPQYEGTVAFNEAISYAAWVENDFELSKQCAWRMISLDTSYMNGYLRLGMALLAQNQYHEAFLALSGGMYQCRGESPALKHWNTLAEMLMKGIRQVRFSLDGIEYGFELTCFNGQAMESSATHASGMLTEIEELRIIRQEVQQCRCIVECGALVGNHTVFFIKTLKPQKMFVFDADERSIHQIKRNLIINNVTKEPVDIELIHKAVGEENRRMELFHKPVETTRLSDAVTEKVDFMKIDVDGMEIAALYGARALILRDKPLIMIEVQTLFLTRFKNFLADVGYTVKREIRRECDANYLVAPSC